MRSLPVLFLSLPQGNNIMKQTTSTYYIYSFLVLLSFFLYGLIPGNSEFGLAWDASQVAKERLHDVESKAPSIQH